MRIATYEGRSQVAQYLSQSSQSEHRLFFSVITPSWNQGKFLGGCINSVRAQGDSDFEHLIFDNESTDETSEVAAQFSHVRFFSEKDRGQSDAVNKGLRAARGEIICWLNSDDEYAPGAFAALRREFENPNTNVVFGDVRQVGYDGAGDALGQGVFESRLDLVRWWSGRVKLHQPAVFFRRTVLEKTGLLRENLHYAMDYEFWWRMSEYFEFTYMPKVLAVQHRQPDSKSIMAWRKVLMEREQIFSPHYALIGEGGQLAKEKSLALSKIYLDQAYAVAASRPAQALGLMLRSMAEWPMGFWGLQWAGVIRRAVGRFLTLFS
jgi:glycosyltransferase involved in cell wall biosynthesis